MIAMDEELELVRQKLISDAKMIVDGEPIKWFDELYKIAMRKSEMIPWARMAPNPKMLEWLKKNRGTGKALVVGCGLGDDAVALEEFGFSVTAFDISEHCINWCKERFPNSNIKWTVGDILNPNYEWINCFDLVVEVHILQAIPDGGIRELAAKQLPRLLASNGKLLCIGRLDTGKQTIAPPPWPLSQLWLENSFKELKLSNFSTFIFQDTRDVIRYCGTWQKIVS